VEVLFFYLFFTVVCLSSLGVIFFKNPISNVFSLIVTFLSVASLLILSGEEFLSFVLIIVYAGAVSVLFLFVVMFLNSNAQQKTSFIAEKLKKVGFLIFSLLFSSFTFSSLKMNFTESSDKQSPSLEIFSEILSTDYCILLQLCGLILTVAMIGAIVITKLIHPKYQIKPVVIKKQNLQQQATRESKLLLHDLEPYEGLK
jgi:NADH-quinone oxidoreductase subunit J